MTLMALKVLYDMSAPLVVALTMSLCCRWRPFLKI